MCAFEANGLPSDIPKQVHKKACEKSAKNDAFHLHGMKMWLDFLPLEYFDERKYFIKMINNKADIKEEWRLTDFVTRNTPA